MASEPFDVEAFEKEIEGVTPEQEAAAEDPPPEVMQAIDKAVEEFGKEYYEEAMSILSPN